MTNPLARRPAGAPDSTGGQFAHTSRPEPDPLDLIQPTGTYSAVTDEAVVRSVEALTELLTPRARKDLITRLLAQNSEDSRTVGYQSSAQAQAFIPDDYPFETPLPRWPDDLSLPDVSVRDEGNGLEVVMEVDYERAIVRKRADGDIEVTWHAVHGRSNPEFTPEQARTVNAYAWALHDRADQVSIEVAAFAFDSVTDRIADLIDRQ
ncbi:hypothetical protein GCM10027059_12470 [Myceligenerans halotolerans]